jgi:hypothetical protein
MSCEPLATPLILGDDRERPPLFFTPAERKQFRDTTLSHEYVRVFLSKYESGQYPARAQLPRQQQSWSSQDTSHR